MKPTIRKRGDVWVVKAGTPIHTVQVSNWGAALVAAGRMAQMERLRRQEHQKQVRWESREVAPLPFEVVHADPALAAFVRERRLRKRRNTA